jgi:hypothetical protein
MANFLISRFVPDFVTQGIIDHDYTMLALRRYAEATRHYWAQTLKKIKTQNAKTVGPLASLQRNEMRSYRECRKNFDATQTKYDSFLQKYAAASKQKEPSALREDAFQLSETRKAYVKACFDLCSLISVVERRVNVVLVETLVDPWILRSKSLVVGDPTYYQIGVDMYRIKSWSRALSASLKPIEAEMLRLRQEMEESTITRSIPSRDLNDYVVQTATVSQFVPDKIPKNVSNEKHGWLFVRTAGKPRYNWVRRWAFVKDGMFGWLMLSPSKTFVQESEKIGVLLCNVSPEPNEDRRFCFEVRTKDSILVLQAESLAELKAWLQVFEVSKRQVVEKSHASSSAFQLVRPLIPEFAGPEMEFNVGSASPSISSGATVSRRSTDVSARSAPKTATSTVPNAAAGYLTTPDASKLQAMMNAGKIMILSSLTDPGTGHFSSLGPAAAEVALAPKPLINTPMPTSMTKEAILTNAFITSTTVPSAFTANYWGSVNWAAYQSQPPGEVGDRQHGVIPTLAEPYPDFYPTELRSQDTQMRALFQQLADPDMNDRVVMVFRALFRPNPKQELPGRVFVTLRNIYLYSCSFGFTILSRKYVTELVSVEGTVSTGWDTLHLLTNEGETLSCRVFIDSGRTLRKRMQYLIDNQCSEVPAGLEEAVEKLRAICSEKSKISPEDIDEDGSSGEEYDEEYGTTSKKLLQKYLALTPKEKETTDTTRMEIDPVQKALAIESNVASMMDKLMASREYDVPPKALFHVMFGEMSPVFKYKETSMYNREQLTISPWKLVSSRRLEREMSYVFSSKEVLTGGQGHKGERTVTVQRIERKEDNIVYIVYDRRTPWELPYGATFYLTSRFVIAYAGKSRSKLSIWSSIEWIKSAAIARNVVESLVYHHYTVEAKTVADRVAECRKKLGHRGMSVTAIRFFGKLGVSKSIEVGPGEDGQQEDEEERTTYRPIALTKKYLIGTSAGVLGGWLVSIVSSVFMLIAGLGRRVWGALALHKLLLVGLLVSIGYNFILSGRSSTSFWADRSAERISRSIHVIPDSSTVMRRALYLGEISDIINSGRGMAHEGSGPCYNKFRSVAYYPPFDDTDYDVSDYAVAFDMFDWDDTSKDFAKRIHHIRNELGIRRNDLLVNLRILNRIEQETLFAEWRNWLLQELSVCSTATKLNGTTPEPIEAYCKSCLKEWNSAYEGARRPVL